MRDRVLSVSYTHLERFDNDAIIDQLEAKIRAKVAQQDPKNRII